MRHFTENAQSELKFMEILQTQYFKVLHDH